MMETEDIKQKKMVTLFVDDQPYQAEEGQNLLHACLSLGFNVPYFCWHPAFGSVGACRQCAVKRFKDEKDAHGEIVMSCMTAVADGLRISISDPEVVEFRAAIIEFLMTNHPHDCPVCDEGGECHLQDMTVMTGHNYRDFRFKKRTHRNQNLGAFINHEMNRCIQCYRCVRFYCNFAGGRDLNVFASHNHVYFGRHADGFLENEFSGNLVEICPTGVYTDKTQKAHNTRKWDLQTAPSVCVHCGLGCNTLPGERYGTLRRVRNRYHHEINGYFLCDRGRFGYEFVNSERRITRAMAKTGRESSLADVSDTDLIKKAASAVFDRSRVVGIGSPRASLESNFALRELVGADRFFAGVSESDFELLNLGRKILTDGPARTPSLAEIMRADAILILGEDVTQTAPLMALALRQMRYQKALKTAEKVHLPEWNDAGIREFAQQETAALFIASPFPTKLDSEAQQTFHAPPDDLVRLAVAVRSALDSDSPDADPPDGTGVADQVRSMAAEIVEALKTARRPLVICGTACASAALIRASANIAWTLCSQGFSAGISFCVPECNSMGLALMDAGNLKAAFDAIAENTADTVIILENDLYRRAEGEKVDAFLSKARQVIVLDHSATATSACADMVFPAATVAESTGTLVNNEGRAQRFYSVYPPVAPIQESWRHIAAIMSAASAKESASWHHIADIAADMGKSLPVFTALEGLEAAVDPSSRFAKIPRQSHRYSGRTAMRANINVSEPAPPRDGDTPLAYSMEGDGDRPPAGLIPRYWAPGWNSVQALNKFQQEVGGPLRGGDPGIRLLSAADSGRIPYFDMILPDAEEAENRHVLVPVYHFFGSEELSMGCPRIAEQTPAPYIALNPEDPLAAGATEVSVTIGEVLLHLPVRPVPGWPEKTAGLPVGLPGLPYLRLPVRAEILKRTKS